MLARDDAEKMVDISRNCYTTFFGAKILPKEVVSSLIVPMLLSDSHDKRFDELVKCMIKLLDDPEGNELDDINSSILLRLVLNRDITRVKQFMNKRPGLLLQRACANDLAGRRYNMSPYNAAICVHDIEIMQMMEAKIDELPDGKIMRAKCFLDAFPNGMPTSFQPYSLDQLCEVLIQADSTQDNDLLLDGDDDSQLAVALKRFREAFHEVAIRESFYNPYHLLAALKIYRDQLEYYGIDIRRTMNGENVKPDWFFCRVIGFIEKYMPLHYMKSFVQGFRKDDAARSAPTISHHSEALFQLFCANKDGSKLGYEYGYDFDSASGSGMPVTGDFSSEGRVEAYQSFVDAKMAYLNEQYEECRALIHSHEQGLRI